MSNQTKHTPGPWRSAAGSIITEDDTRCIAVIEDDGGYEAPEAERDANAFLIAAAPELLAAAEKLLSTQEAYSDAEFPGSTLLDALDIAKSELRSAVTKAKGKAA